MRLKFNKGFFIAAVILFVIETCIAILLKDGFIRHTFGDFLVVILIYCAIRSFAEISPIKIALFVLFLSFIIEFAQYFDLLEYFNIKRSKILTIILGSTFHISDLIAYTFGTIIILIIDLKTIQWKL